MVAITIVGRAGRARYGRRVAEAEMSRSKTRLPSTREYRGLGNPPFAGNLYDSADELGVADQPRAARKLAGARFRLPSGFRDRSYGAARLPPVFDPAILPHPAKAMMPPQRRQLALEALAGAETVSRLAGQHTVSRKACLSASCQGRRGPRRRLLACGLRR